MLVSPDLFTSRADHSSRMAAGNNRAWRQAGWAKRHGRQHSHERVAVFLTFSMVVHAAHRVLGIQFTAAVAAQRELEAGQQVMAVTRSPASQLLRLLLFHTNARALVAFFGRGEVAWIFIVLATSCHPFAN